jgi:hypothetical protein
MPDDLAKVPVGSHPLLDHSVCKADQLRRRKVDERRMDSQGNSAPGCACDELGRWVRGCPNWASHGCTSGSEVGGQSTDDDARRQNGSHAGRPDQSRAVRLPAEDPCRLQGDAPPASGGRAPDRDLGVPLPCGRGKVRCRERGEGVTGGEFPRDACRDPPFRLDERGDHPPSPRDWAVGHHICQPSGRSKKEIETENASPSLGRALCRTSACRRRWTAYASASLRLPPAPEA